MSLQWRSEYGTYKKRVRLALICKRYKCCARGIINPIVVFVACESLECHSCAETWFSYVLLCMH